MFTEDSRVKIPTILHLVRLGYNYISKKDHPYDDKTNIFKQIFFESVKKINSELKSIDLENFYRDTVLALENEDLGKSFYEKLINQSGIKLIDFANFKNNTFNVLSELTYKKDDEEFRPDITILINGLPLIFIEVKKPNNKDGILAEQKRMQSRFKNKKFKNFINITQLILFSNNMEYDDSSHLPLEGAFYSTTSYTNSNLNYFREEENFDLSKIISNIKSETEDFILRDNNLVGIKNSPEYITNKNLNTPTKRLCTSILQKERLAFLLNYGITYVKNKNGLEKHVMRYPQLFATLAIKKTLDKDKKSGVIWHTQGSGKTALASFSVKYLLDYFRSKNKISKYYFIVDRLDLLKQASREFRSRGLIVHNINSKESFVKDIKSTSAIHNDTGKMEITVVNIQKFKDDPSAINNNDYNLKIQRIYFLDEVHRSYNPKGSFLANLHVSDPNSIKIGLTGTPLLGKDNSTRKLFGDYIHKYFYNSSIADGYTLRLIREEIENQRKSKLDEILKQIKLIKGSIDRKDVYSDKRIVEPMLDYIIEDFEKFRLTMNDNSVGALVVCDSYEQAEQMNFFFKKNYLKNIKKDHSVKSAELILYDTGTKDDRDEIVESFKQGNVDILFVYNMLLTGFDSPRLKKIYLGRKIKSHNLLQALTRVNRTYKNFRYGYVVDFADIEKEFDETNRAYFDELQLELGDEFKNYTNMFKDDKEILLEINEIKNVLFEYDTKNKEIFSKQISEIDEKKQIVEVVKVLNNTRELYNLLRLSGKHELLEKVDFKNISNLFQIANNRLNLINTREALENKSDISGLLNVALEDLVISFKKVKVEEMKITDEYVNILRKTRESLASNFDKFDPVFISLKEELENLFKKKNLKDISKNEMEKNIIQLQSIYKKSKDLKRENDLLSTKYDNDTKYVRLHKRLIEKKLLTDDKIKLFDALKDLKIKIDQEILSNSNILENQSFVEKKTTRLIIDQLKNMHKLPLSLENTKYINSIIFKEYVSEYNGQRIS